MVSSMWNSGRNWLLLGTLAVAVCATPVASATDHDPAPAPAAAKTKAVKAAAARRHASAAAAAAGQSAPTMTSDRPRAFSQGSLLGTPGLFNSQFAETVAPGYATAGVYANRYTLEPGGQVVTDVQSGWTVGITKWLDLNFATTPYRRIRTGSPEQLSFRVNNNFTSFNNDNPFTRNNLITGPVDFTVGLTFGLLSQDRGAPFGLAIQPFLHIPYNQAYNPVVQQFGVGTGELSYGENIMVDKWLGNAGALVFNGGWLHTNKVDRGPVPVSTLIPRDEITWGYGVVFPRRSNVQGIVELNGNIPYGAGTHSQYFGPNAPIWSTYGIRLSPIPWMGINAGYRYADNAKVGNKHGFVFGLSFGSEPPAPVLAPPTPSLNCSADATTVAPGTAVHLTGAVSPTGYPYTYTWTTTGGKLDQSQNTATLDTTGLAPGVYTVASHVDNGQGGFADCKTDVELREPAKNPPTVTASADPASVLPGGASTLTAVCSSPDQRPLTFGWTVTAGKLDTNNQAVAHLDTTDVAPGTITGTVTCTDDRGLAATADTTVTVQAPAAAPAATLATTLAFKTNSARVDNVAKAALDDVALRLQQDPNAKAVIVGFSDSSEHNADLLAKQRAVNAKAYLTSEKGIAADRIEVRSDTTTGGTKAEVWIVPQGATYTGSAQPFDESGVTPMAAHHAPARHHHHHRRHHHAAAATTTP